MKKFNFDMYHVTIRKKSIIYRLNMREIKMERPTEKAMIGKNIIKSVIELFFAGYFMHMI